MEATRPRLVYRRSAGAEAGVMAGGKKPINLEMKGLKNNRQRIWEVLRAGREGIATGEIAQQAKVDVNTVRVYLLSLQRAGYVAPVGTAGLFEVRPWRLVRDCGVEAPAITRDGTPSRTGLVNEAMWRTLRILGEVSAEELAEQASASVPTTLKTASSYLRWLRKAGYVVESTPGKVGCKGRPARYSLVPGKYTGPKAPMLQRSGAQRTGHQLFDPNLGEIVFVNLPKPGPMEGARV
ncbi:hypothetical protein HZR81_17555 [Pseudomonas sp. LM13]